MSKTHREGIQLCKTANTSHSLFSSSKHLMLTLPLNLMQNVNVNWQFDAFIKSVLGQLSLSHAQSFHVLKNALSVIFWTYTDTQWCGFLNMRYGNVQTLNLQ